MGGCVAAGWAGKVPSGWWLWSGGGLKGLGGAGWWWGGWECRAPNQGQWKSNHSAESPEALEETLAEAKVCGY